MRVISGKARGHRLQTPVGLDVRPTLDRVKEAVFSSIMPYLLNASVLDLFSGSGGLGIEALSRGAAFCDFVDASKASVAATRKNLEGTRLSQLADVHFSDWSAYLKGNEKTYSLVFLDPPYSKGIEEAVMPVLHAALSEGAIVVLETEYAPTDFTGYSMLRQARYGRVVITVYKKV